MRRTTAFRVQNAIKLSWLYFAGMISAKSDLFGHSVYYWAVLHCSQPISGISPTNIARWVLLLASVPTDFLLHWFCPPTANLRPPHCRLQWQRVGFQTSTPSLIMAAGLFCAEAPHDYQWPTGRPMDVIRQPPLSPLYCHSLLGRQLQNVCRVPTNMAPSALLQALGGQPSHGGQPTIYWVAQRWAAI